MAKELKIQMTLDASGVKKGAKEAEQALNAVSDAAEETGEGAGKSSAKFQEWGKKVSNVGKTLKYDLTSSTKTLQEQFKILQNGLVSGNLSGGTLEEAKTALREIRDELDKRTQFFGVEEEAKLSSEYFSQLAEKMRDLTARKKELEKAGTTLGYEEYDKTLQKLNELRAMLKAYQADLYEEHSQGSYESAIKTLKAEMAALDAKGEGLGTDAYDERYQELLRTTAALKEYKKALADTVAQENASADNMTAQLAQAQAELSSLANAGLGFGDENYDAQYQEVARLTAELKEYKKALEDGATATKSQSSALSRLATVGKTAGSAILRVAGNVGNLAKNAASSAISSIGERIRSIGNSAKSAADGGLDNMVKGIRNIGVVSLGLKLCTSLFGRLRSIVSNYVSENETLSASVTRLKNGLGQALAPAINVVINAMEKLLPYIIGVADAVASLITNIFGTGWTSVSTGASTAADAVDDVADATDDATAAQEAYNRTVAGFDEITKLNDNSSSGSSGTGSTGSTGATASTTDSTEGIAGILPGWLANIASLIENSQWAELGTYLADCLGSAVDKIYDVLTSEATYAKIDSAVNALTTTVNSFFKEMNLVDDATGESIASKTGRAIGAAINLAAYTVNSVVTGIDWGEIGLTIANVINGAVEETDWSLIGETISNVFLVLPKTLYSVIVNTDWGAITGGLSEMIISAVTNVTDWLYDLDMTAVADSIYDALAGVDWLGVAGAIVEFLATAIGKSLELLAALGEDIAEGLVNGIGGFFTDIGEWIDENILQPFIKGIKSIFGIASPAKNEELVSAGENIGLGLLNAIASVFTNIGTWVQNNILTPISKALSSAGDFVVSVGVALSNTASDVWNTFKTAWGKLSNVAVSIANSLKSTASSLWNTFKSNWGTRAVSIANSLKTSAGNLWSSFKSNWGSRAVSIGNSLKTSAASLWSAFKEKWGTRTANITNKLVNTAADLWEKFKSGWKNKTLGLTITYNTNVGAVKKAVYKALGLSGWPTIKFAAKGGIVDRATLFGDTVAGEAGQEAIVPLERNTQWADIVATQIANKLATSGGGNQTVTINTYVTLDGKVVGKASADYAINQARATGQLPWAAYT